MADDKNKQASASAPSKPAPAEASGSTRATGTEEASAAALKQRQEEIEAAKSAIEEGVAPAVSPAEATNPKFAAQPGTLPPSMQGVSLPHPSTDKPAPALDTPEMAKARARADAAVAAEDLGDNAPTNVGKPVGEPVQCIAKRKFYDERGALIRAGATYYYQRREGTPFPIRTLEPVSQALAKSLRTEARDAEEAKISRMQTRQERRDAFARLAAETE